MNGKGDSPRPFSVSQEEFRRRWDLAMRDRYRARRPKNTNTQEEIELGRRMLTQPNKPKSP